MQYKDSVGTYILNHLEDNDDKLDLLQCLFDERYETSRLRQFFYQPRGQFGGTPDKSNLQSPLGQLHLKWLLLKLQKALTEDETDQSFKLVTDIKTLLKGQLKHPIAFIRHPDDSKTTFLNFYRQLLQLACKKFFNSTYRTCAMDIINNIRNGKCQISEAFTSNDKRHDETFINILSKNKSLLQRSDRYINELRTRNNSDGRGLFFNREDLPNRDATGDLPHDFNPPVYG